MTAKTMSVSERVQKGLLKPNVNYSCIVCGKQVKKYVSPYSQKNQGYTNQYCSRKCKGIELSGKKHHMWNGGRKINKQGYVLVYNPKHKYADKKGYIREHRLIVEQSIGRYLLPAEVVHHINGNTSDNRIENLRLFDSNANHKSCDYHARRKDKMGRLLPLQN